MRFQMRIFSKRVQKRQAEGESPLKHSTDPQKTKNGQIWGADKAFYIFLGLLSPSLGSELSHHVEVRP